MSDCRSALIVDILRLRPRLPIFIESVLVLFEFAFLRDERVKYGETLLILRVFKIVLVFGFEGTFRGNALEIEPIVRGLV